MDVGVQDSSLLVCGNASPKSAMIMKLDGVSVSFEVSIIVLTERVYNCSLFIKKNRAW